MPLASEVSGYIVTECLQAIEERREPMDIPTTMISLALGGMFIGMRLAMEHPEWAQAARLSVPEGVFQGMTNVAERIVAKFPATAVMEVQDDNA